MVSNCRLAGQTDLCYDRKKRNNGYPDVWRKSANSLVDLRIRQGKAGADQNGELAGRLLLDDMAKIQEDAIWEKQFQSELRALNLYGRMIAFLLINLI